MLKNIFVAMTAMCIGIVASLSLVYISKFKEFFINKKEDSANFWGIADFIWRISLPVLFGIIALIMPVKIIYYFFDNKYIINDLSSIYLFFFAPSFFISIFLLIKVGKIKIDKKIK